MKRILLLCTALTILAGSAMAEPFQITPMRLHLEAGGDTGNITVFNSGDSAMNMQVKAMAWAQDKTTGADQLSATKELIFFPKIFSIPAKGKQVVRVGYQGNVEGNEKSYRLFVRELPVDKPGVTGARFVVQISMPAFVYPKGVQQPLQPTISAVEVHDGNMVLRATNNKQRYYSMNKIEISGKAAGKEVYKAEVGGWYVLAGASRLFPLNISKADCLKMDTIALTGHVLLDQDKQGGESHAEFPIAASLCQQVSAKNVAKP